MQHDFVATDFWTSSLIAFSACQSLCVATLQVQRNYSHVLSTFIWRKPLRYLLPIGNCPHAALLLWSYKANDTYVCVSLCIYNKRIPFLYLFNLKLPWLKLFQLWNSFDKCGHRLMLWVPHRVWICCLMVCICWVFLWMYWSSRSAHTAHKHK